MLRIIILGSGIGIPYKKRGAPGILINSNKHWMLMDAGSGTLSRLAKLDIDYKNIDFLLFSHRFFSASLSSSSKYSAFSEDVTRPLSFFFLLSSRANLSLMRHNQSMAVLNRPSSDCI